MSLPRQLLPGSTYLLTRRCAQRAFLLVPDDQTNAIVAYCLAEAARRSGVEIHCFVAMSNHIHAVVTDPQARLPQFLHFLDRHIAVCVNARLGRTENVWASGEPSVVALIDADEILDKMAYVIANPTAAGLVEAPEQWPGVITPQLGHRRTATRPAVYFRRTGTMPLAVELHCTVPPPLRHLEFQEVAQRLAANVRRRVRAARVFMADSGRRFLGPPGVLVASSSQAATTPEPMRARRPRFAAREGERRRRFIAGMRAFHRSYKAALAQWRDGIRSVVFPIGTYLMRVLHGATCEGLAPAG